MCYTYFTHIPKTAGTSFIHSVIKPTFGDKYFGPFGFKNFILTKYPEKSCFGTHLPYGFHYFKPFKKYKYITFLRDPIDRAISHYFFVLQTRLEGWAHPDLARHEKFSLEDIWHDSSGMGYGALQSNLQVKFIAGLTHGYYIPHSQKKILEIAKENLKNKYSFFGLKEHFVESCEIAERKFSWKIEVATKKHMKTSNKKELSDKTILAIENANELDSELYSYALKLFRDQ